MSKRARFLVAAAVFLVVVAICVVGRFAWVKARAGVINCAIVQDFKDIEMAMGSHAKRHRKRVSSLSELDFGSEQSIVDPRTNEPYIDLLDKNVYVYDRKKNALRKAYVMSSIYRTKMWPFGERRRLVLHKYGRSSATLAFDEEQIIELAPEYQVTEKKSEGE